MAKAKHSNGRLFRFLTGSPLCTNKQYSVGSRAVTAQAISRSRGMRPTQAITAKKLQQPYKESLQPFFRNKKPQNPYLQILVFLPHLSSSPDLRIISSHTAFSDFSNDRLSSNVGASTHTVAVPSGTCTRFSILLWCCYHIHKHSNGIFTCEVSIHDTVQNVNQQKHTE